MGKVLLLCILITLAYFSRSFLQPGYFYGHDTAAHITRAEAYIQAIKEGQFPVRYIGWAFDGVGSPIFNHYPIGFYLIVAVLNMIGLPFHLVFQGVVWGAWMGTGLGILMVFKHKGLVSALGAASLWWFSAYAAMEIFLRGAYPELLAICWTIWLWYSLKRSFFLTSLFTFLLVITHLPTLVIVAVPLALYAFFFDRKRLLRTMLAVLIGLIMAGFYILPSLTELRYLKASELHSDYYDYQWHFLALRQLFVGNWHYGYSNPGYTNDASFKITYGQWWILGLGTVVALMFRRKQLIFWAAISLMALWLSLAAAKPLWDVIPFLAFIQYPWRTHLLATIGIAWIGGMLLMAKSKAVKIVTVIGILMTGLETATWFVPFRIIEENLYPSTAFARHTPPYPEIGIEEAYTPARSNIEAALQLPAFWNFEYKKTVIKSSHLTSIKASAIIVSPEPQTVIVKRWFLPGWSAMIDNVPVPINLDPKTGLIWMLLPPGEHLLEVGYTGSKIEELGNRLALVGVIVWMTITVQDRRVGRLRRHDEDKSLRGRK